MNKKIIAAAAILAVLAAFTGCGKDSDSSSSKSAAASASSASAASTEASTEASTAAETTGKKTTAESTTEASTEKNENVTIPDFDISSLAGKWIYENSDGSSAEFVAIPDGTVYIAEDGTYTYNDGSSLTSGTIEWAYEEYSDGSKVPYLAFRTYGGDMFIGCYVDSDTDASECLYIGNGGMSRLVRDNDDSSEPDDGNTNPYGFYVYTDPIRTDAAFNSVKALEGKWMHGQFLLEITDCDDYMGAFTDDNESGAYMGMVRLEYKIGSDGQKELWYNLYTNDGGLYKSFRATQEIPLDVLYDETGNGFEHTRIKPEQ